ncbi:MAG TPA: hypothetical protein VHD63_05920 [Ktedonobacteraceae bacterium]|jgi:hypothetical protein|nr:hypothetical protein [Ktedonobacteraceae bacterium]
MKWARKHIRIALILCFVLCLAGCGTSASNPVGFSSLQVTRSSNVRDNHFPPLTKTIQNQAIISHIYQAIQNLPPSQSRFCPLDTGLQYVATFTQQNGSQESVTLSASGCRIVTISGSDRRATNNTFWQLFAQALGISQENVFVNPE